MILRVYVLDSDRFMGGRKQTVTVGGQYMGTIENFEKGRWLEVPLKAEDTASGGIRVRAHACRPPRMIETTTPAANTNTIIPNR